MSDIDSVVKLTETKISQGFNKDKAGFKRRLKRITASIKSGDAEKAGATLNQLLKQAEHSATSLQIKRSAVPEFDFPDSLPITARLADIEAAINQHQVVIICGETGSGKTTQLPKLCLRMGRGIDGQIGHTQPRRLAARSVAARIAEEMNSELGAAVGYKVRFKDQSLDSSYIKLMTDGILLAEIQKSPLLKQYDTLIIDEAHERSLNIDFLLGYLKRLLPKRPELKVIITSATIDPEKFSDHFDKAPIILVSGRTYPVEVRYRPYEKISLSEAIAEAVDELIREKEGDILVFLSGERDIRDAAEVLRKKLYRHTEVLPLLARLSAQEQNRIFHPGGLRRIILATNVAETSLTVPGIRYVVDSGLARISRYSFRSKMQRLPIESISRAAADQRKGRCGRVAEGICIRLYDEHDFNGRAEFTEAEIHRTNLASVILQMAYTGMGDMENFPFVDIPDPRLINDGVRLLKELNAYDDNGITATGREMAAFPLDPQLSRMIVEANKESCLKEMLIIVSALAIQDPRERPVDKQQAADERHRPFQNKKSDFLFYINCWQAYQEKRKELSQNKTRQWCSKNFLAYMRMREWQDVHEQLVSQVKLLGYRLNMSPQQKQNNDDSEYDAVHRSILTGILSHIGFKTEEEHYLGTRGRKFFIFPGSGLFKKKPKLVMAAEIVETQKVYARTNAVIQLQWLEEKARHLLKYQYSEPHWQKKTSQVSADQSALLYGLTIYAKKKVNFGPIDPDAARKIFIWALVNGEYEPRARFLSHNQSLMSDIHRLEAKSRRQDVLVDEQVLYDFYDQRIKQGIANGPAFEKWWQQEMNRQPELLNMQRDELMQHDASTVSKEQFPDVMRFNGIKLKLEYIFDPKLKHDGICLHVPLIALNAVDAVRCEWLVAGMLREKVIALIRSLPKTLRRNFVPVPDFADACLQSMVQGERPLTVEMAAQLKRITGVSIPFDAWRTDLLDDYLFMSFKLVDNQGDVIKQSKDLLGLQQQTESDVIVHEVSEDLSAYEIDSVVQWDFGELKNEIVIQQAGIELTFYPALKKEGSKVALRLFDNQQQAAHCMGRGLSQLIRINLSEQLHTMQQTQKGLQAMCLLYRNIGSCQDLSDDLMAVSINDAFALDPLPLNASDYHKVLHDGREKMSDTLKTRYMQCAEILELNHGIQKRLKKLPLNLLDAGSDIQDQCQHLLFKHFMLETHARQLSYFPRYLKAINARLDKLESDNSKDRALRLKVQPYWDNYKNRLKALQQQKHQSVVLEEFRWLIEEYRVSLFAQSLKTAVPVSEKRLNQCWEEVKLGV
ncbi:MAG: ATP-dependent RNA helicase HrpA [Gammaproteobacteria bacterium]|nr:ATP-dependent RNA helicase HrpA [Gammaproteobacteria bacterium]